MFLTAGLVICAAGFVVAADISTHSFNSGLNCYGAYRLPDTGQNISYTATVGEDHDYSPAAVQQRYTIYNPVGVSSVTADNVTGLMWVTDPMTDAGFKGVQTWESALTSCTVTLNGMAYAGYSDWRLPNAKELQSIVDYGRQIPSINTTYFLNTQSNNYWSSTTSKPSTTGAWTVFFFDGTMLNFNKTFTYCVRCVRGGP